MRLGLVSLNNGFVPQLGLGSIATYVEKKLGIEKIRIFDNNYEDILQELLNYRPDVIGIGAMTLEYGKAIKLAKAIRERLDVPILIGGSHISTLPSSMKNCFDIAIIGEAEQTMLELIREYEKEGTFTYQNLKKIEGIQFFDKKNRLIRTDKRELINNLDSLPIIDMKFFNKNYFKKKKLHYTTATCNKIEAYMLTSRGCPYRCSFCSSSILWERIRFNSPQHVINQIKHLIEYKADHIEIWDDLFTINRKRLEEIIRLKKEEGIPRDITFSCQPRADLIDDDICGLLKKLNAVTVTFGFESGCEKTIKFLKGKTSSVENNKAAIKLCKKYGFRVYGSVIFAVPGETISDMRETIEFIKFARKNGADQIRPFILIPLPGTKVWQIAKEGGIIDEQKLDWEEFGYYDIISDYSMNHPPLLDPKIRREDFLKIFEEARKITKSFRWKLFYDYLKNNPLSMTKEILSLPSYYIKKATKHTYVD